MIHALPSRTHAAKNHLSRPPQLPMHALAPTYFMPRYEPWTLFTAGYAKGRLSMRLRFGDPQHVWHSGNGVTYYWFAPGQPFAVSWWARLSLRRQVAGFAVAEALRIGRSRLSPALH